MRCGVPLAPDSRDSELTVRVLVLTNIYPPHHYGGYELACEMVVERWRAAGHEVEVATGNHLVEGVATGEEPGVMRGLHFYWSDHELLRPSPLRRLAWERENLRRWRSLLDRFRPDVVSVWNHGTMSYALLAEVEERGIPMVLVVADQWLCWGPDYDRWTSMFQRHGPAGRLLGWAVRRLTGIPTDYPDLGSTAVALYASDWLRQEAERSSRFRFERSTVVPWGIDPDLFPAVDREPHPFRWQLVLVGRLDERKGALSAVRAMTELPEATLRLVGPATAAQRAALDRVIGEVGVGDRVVVEQVPPAEVGQRYLDADVALFPSEWNEPFGLVGLEAMACGVPLVATGTGGSADYLRHGENALLVPPGDPGAIAAAVRRLAGDAPLRRRLVEQGLETARRYTSTAMADELERWHEAVQRSVAGPGPC